MLFPLPDDLVQGSLRGPAFLFDTGPCIAMPDAYIFVFLMNNYMILIVKITSTLSLGVIVYIQFVMDVLCIAWKDVDDDGIGRTFRGSRAERGR